MGGFAFLTLNLVYLIKINSQMVDLQQLPIGIRFHHRSCQLEVFLLHASIIHNSHLLSSPEFGEGLINFCYRCSDNSYRGSGHRCLAAIASFKPFNASRALKSDFSTAVSS